MLNKVVAYRISPSSVRLSQEQTDLVVKGNERICLSPNNTPPKFIHMNSNTIISGNDFPSNNQRLPIFSKISLKCLGKDWEYNTVPVHISGEEEQEWIALQFKQFTDALDLRASEYDEDDLYPNNVGYLHKIIFKRGLDLPPIFQIEETEGVFVTPETRLKWDMNNISGIRYYPVFMV